MRVLSIELVAHSPTHEGTTLSHEYDVSQVFLFSSASFLAFAAFLLSLSRDSFYVRDESRSAFRLSPKSDPPLDHSLFHLK
mmetsp:Transcript_32865/g.65083  ORF Transcript_32865/g.65083 Transcript_32865/m.65083 type:complete len:81 (-) Transcript_32865:518-760(-)